MPSAQALVVGDRVTANQPTNVRNSPGGTLIGSRATSDAGTLIGGPTGATLGSSYYIWWQVDWDTGVDGWCFEGGLALAEDPNAVVVYGIDVSRWQSVVNWPAVYGEGKRFAFAKATQGVSTVDPQYANNATNGRAAGMLMGFYHFAAPEDNPAVAEARHFVSTIRPQLLAGNLIPVLDLESGESIGASALSAWARAFCQEVERLTLLRPAIYVNRNFAANYLAADLSIYPLWIAVPGFTPGSPVAGIGAWSRWTFQQYSWTGRLAGIGSGGVDTDLNAFNGTLADLSAYQIPVISQSIASAIVSPGSASAGSAVTLTLNCEATHSRPVLIGASLFPAGTGTGGISDSAHEGPHALTAGGGALSRTFSLPAGLATGSYDLWTALYLDVNQNGIVDSGDAPLTSIHKSLAAMTVSAPPTFATWAAAAGLAGADAAADADPDFDGSPNLLEYAAGTLPKAGTSRPVSAIRMTDSGRLEFTFARAGQRPDLTWTIQRWVPPAGWADLATAAGDAPFTAAGIVESAGGVTLTLDMPANVSSLFLRLMVSRP